MDLNIKFSLILTMAAVWLSSAASPETYFGGQDNDAYVAWASSLDYPATAFVPSSDDPDLGAALHWKIVGDQYLELGVAVRATGWLGFGLTVNGGMTGSDMVLFEAAHPTIAKDAFVQDQRLPMEDDCQDWQLLNSTIDSSFIMVQLRRKLDTGDSQDLVIHNDTDVFVPVSRVIAAWGDDETVSYHGPNRARGALRWFSQGNLEQASFDELMSVQADGNVLLAADQHAILAHNQTEYAHFCFTTADLEEMGIGMEDGATIIGLNPYINNTKHVHHLILQASFSDVENMTACQQGAVRGEILYLWAPGEPAFAFPDNVGFQLGGEQGYRSFMLEIHYNNPDFEENQVDSSGVEVYYSTQPREHTAGYYIVGDPILSLIGQEIPAGVADYSFQCPGTCSEMFANDTDKQQEPITVLREYLHMHQSGISSSLEHIRQGQVIRRSSVDYFDFAQTGAPAIQQGSITIQPGDAFQMRCYYHNEQQGRTFGFGSSNEMCVAFLLYYPRKSIDLGGGPTSLLCGAGLAEIGLSDCQGNYTLNVLTSDESPDRTFGTPSDTCDTESTDSSETPGDETSAGSEWNRFTLPTWFLMVTVPLLL